MRGSNGGTAPVLEAKVWKAVKSRRAWTMPAAKRAKGRAARLDKAAADLVKDAEALLEEARRLRGLAEQLRKNSSDDK